MKRGNGSHLSQGGDKALPLRGPDCDGLGKEANVMASQIHFNCVDVICSMAS